MSINREVDKEDVVHIYSGISLSHKKVKIMPIAATWMDLEMIILSEESQTETIRYRLYVESKEKHTNKLIYKMEIKLQM